MKKIFFVFYLLCYFIPSISFSINAPTGFNVQSSNLKQHTPIDLSQYEINTSNEDWYEAKNDIHKFSYAFLLYFIIVSCFIIWSDEVRKIAFSFSLNQSIEISTILTLVLLVLMSLMLTFVIHSSLLLNLFFYFIIYFLVVFLIGKGIKTIFNVDVFYKRKIILLFKMVNVIFCLFIISNIFYYGELLFPLNTSLLINIIVLFSSLYSLLILIKEYRFNSTSYIFYYICAFEILPAFYLKAFLL